MGIKVVLFDLDGTLLPLNQDIFVKSYFGRLAKHLAPFGYEAEGLIKSIWAGTAKMVKNNGDKTNEEVFWDEFASIHGESARSHMPEFERFYKDEFHKVKESCGYTPKAANAVKEIKSLGLRVALATNPIFPAIATRQRIEWAGLSPDDFELFTTYENSRHSNPNPEYYKDVTKALGVSPEDCIMVGNDVDEDMRPASALGMKVFLVKDYLINRSNSDISIYPQGTLDDLIEWLKDM